MIDAVAAQVGATIAMLGGLTQRKKTAVFAIVPQLVL